MPAEPCLTSRGDGRIRPHIGGIYLPNIKKHPASSRVTWQIHHAVWSVSYGVSTAPHLVVFRAIRRDLLNL